MDINDIKHLAVERIFLVPDASEGQLGYAWCDDPTPGMGMDPSEAVEYVRKDVHEAIIAKQAKAAISGMDATKVVASSNLEQAKRLHAESSPDALESERAANALLTEQVAKLEAHIAALKDDLEIHRAAEEAQIALRHKADERIVKLEGMRARSRKERNQLCEGIASLQAHVNYMEEIYKQWNRHEIDDKQFLSMLSILINRLPSASLARRDKIKQAEAMEELYDQSALHKVINRGALINRARNLRHQAEAINEPPTKI